MLRAPLNFCRPRETSACLNRITANFPAARLAYHTFAAWKKSVYLAIFNQPTVPDAYFKNVLTPKRH